MMLNAHRGAVLPARGSRQACAVVCKAGKGKQAAAGLLAVATLVATGQAKADEVDTVVEQAISAVKATGEVLRSTLSTVQTGVDALKQGYDAAAPVVTDAIKVATPVVEQAIKVTADAARPAFDTALPTIQEGVKAIEKSTGLTPQVVSNATSVVSKTTTEAVTTVTPAVNKLWQFLTTTDPVLLGEYTLGAIALVYLTPLVLGGVAGSMRGYAGQVGAPAALETICDENNCVLVDIRTSKEKEAAGIPDVPGNASSKVIEVEYAVTEDKKLRSQLRNANAIEAQVTALQIAALKRISGGTKVMLLCRNGSLSAAVARELARKGYGRVYVVSGGFDGRGGWVQSKLQIKPAAASFSTQPPQFARTSVFASKKALPSPRA